LAAAEDFLVGWNWAALASASVLGTVHLFGGRGRAARTWQRPGVLAAASGISVAYVLVHLLPDLADEQRVWVQARGRARPEWLDQQVYVAALVGLIAADGLQRLARAGRYPLVRYGVQEGAMTTYNLLIGYYLVRLRHPLAAAMGTIAFGAHFAVDDHALDEAHGDRHRRYGRRVLSIAVLLGWLLGSTLRLRPAVLSAAFSLVAGGILLRSLQEELVSTHQTQFGAFVGAALVYTALLMAAFYAVNR
jgi:hypothetical protein